MYQESNFLSSLRMRTRSRDTDAEELLHKRAKVYISRKREREKAEKKHRLSW